MGDIAWITKGEFRRTGKPGLSVFYNNATRATFSATAGDVLEDQRIIWGKDSDSGRLVFRLLTDPLDESGQLVKHRQTNARALRRAGAQKGDRIYFVFDENRALFVENFREKDREKFVV